MKRFQLILLPLFYLLVITTACSNKDKDENIPDEPPIDIPEGDVQVAVYYFPNWGPVYSSEWSVVKAAKPRFKGHQHLSK